MIGRVFAAAFLVVGVIVVIGLLLTLPTMWLWNWLMPTLFGLKTITFWQAVGINVLSGILFKSPSFSSSSS